MEEKKTESARRHPELLAPAGTFAHLRAAVNSGADAVYAGGKLFSARANAGNFGDEEMREAVDYCHLRGVKLYVTVNTLIFDEEMEAALRYAAYLYEIGVDALIVQDFGFAACVRRMLPDFPLHLSTQATVYSREGVAAAARLGFERVVLARETPLAEMRAMRETLAAEKLQTELEVFIHGALCFCVSGQCQMSRFRGGRSGNRGACAQPCRLPYTDARGRSSYRLSPKDLCTVDLLPELTEAGVASLKIEGRMKSPEYVAVVTEIYRKYLDAYGRDGYYRVSAGDRRALLQIFNRGGFTDGYLRGNPQEKLMAERLPKHSGVRIGQIVRRGKNDLLEVELMKGEHLALGDGIEIRRPENRPSERNARGLHAEAAGRQTAESSDKEFASAPTAGKLPGNIVTYRKELSDDGRRLLVGDIRGDVRPGDAVFKITDSALSERASRRYATDREGRELTVRRTPVAMRFTARCGEPAELTVWDRKASAEGTGRTLSAVTVRAAESTEKAIHRPVTAERLIAQLGKTGDSVFCVRDEDIEIILDEEVSLPMAAVNALRRRALDALSARKTDSGRRTLPFSETSLAVRQARASASCSGDAHAPQSCACDAHAPLKKADAGRFCAPMIYVHVWREETPAELEKAARMLRAEGACNFMIALPVKTYMEKKQSVAEITLLPYVSHASSGAEDAYVRAHFEEIAATLRAGDSKIICGNLGWLAEFDRAGCRTVGGFGLNAVNRCATGFLMSETGASAVMPSLELARTDGTESAGNTFLCAGALPLMTTEHLLAEERFASSNAFAPARRGSAEAAKAQFGDAETAAGSQYENVKTAESQRINGSAGQSGGEWYRSVTGEYGDKSLIVRDGAFCTLMICRFSGDTAAQGDHARQSR